MSMIKRDPIVYNDGRTKQSFKDSTDINKILKKAQLSGGLSHAMKYDSAIYGEFTGIDLLGAYDQIGRAQTIFNDLPSEVRNEFGQNALKFAAYASAPENIERLAELIPAIAAPGTYFPNPVSRTEVPAVVEAVVPGPDAPVPVAPAAAPVVPPVVATPGSPAPEGGVS